MATKGHKGRKGKKGAGVVLSERDQTLVAMLGEMTAETWERDRQGMLAMLLGVRPSPASASA